MSKLPRMVTTCLEIGDVISTPISDPATVCYHSNWEEPTPMATIITTGAKAPKNPGPYFLSPWGNGPGIVCYLPDYQEGFDVYKVKVVEIKPASIVAEIVEQRQQRELIPLKKEIPEHIPPREGDIISVPYYFPHSPASVQTHEAGGLMATVILLGEKPTDVSDGPFMLSPWGNGPGVTCFLRDCYLDSKFFDLKILRVNEFSLVGKPLGI